MSDEYNDGYSYGYDHGCDDAECYLAVDIDELQRKLSVAVAEAAEWKEIAGELADIWRRAYAGHMTIDAEHWREMKAALARYEVGVGEGE